MDSYDASNVIPNEEITLFNDKVLKLVGSVIYLPGHYVLVFKCDNAWYYYNDNETTNKIVLYANTYSDMINARNQLVQKSAIIHSYALENLISK